MVGLEWYPCCRLKLHMLEFRCGWVGVVSVLQAEAQLVVLQPATFIISLLMCSTWFGHYYIHHQELATILFNYHIGCIVLGSMCVGISVRLVWSGIRVAG